MCLAFQNVTRCLVLYSLDKVIEDILDEVDL